MLQLHAEEIRAIRRRTNYAGRVGYRWLPPEDVAKLPPEIYVRVESATEAQTVRMAWGVIHGALPPEGAVLVVMPIEGL